MLSLFCFTNFSPLPGVLTSGIKFCFKEIPASFISLFNQISPLVVGDAHTHCPSTNTNNGGNGGKKSAAEGSSTPLLMSAVAVPCTTPTPHTQFICRRHDNGGAGTPTCKKKFLTFNLPEYSQINICSLNTMLQINFFAGG